MDKKGFISPLIILCGVTLFGLAGIIYFFYSQAQTKVPEIITSRSDNYNPSPVLTTTPSPTIKENTMPSDIPQPTQVNNAVSKSSLDYFLEIAIGSEYGSGTGGINKWEQSLVGLKQNGEITPASSSCLSTVISDFNNISSKTKLALVDSNADINIFFAPESEFSSLEPNYVPINQGFFWTWWTPEGRIYKANILINSTSEVTDAERCHLIREELTQSMGLKNDSPRYPDSIFYINWTSTNYYSDIDKDVIRLLYNTPIKVGDTKESIQKYFN